MHSALDLRVVLGLVEEREARLRRERLQLRSHAVHHEASHRPVRRWIGRRLVRLGARLAGDTPMRPARAR